MGEAWSWIVLAAAAGATIYYAMWPREEPHPPTEQDGLAALGRAVEKARQEEGKQ